jgi:hypothetical protein
MEVEFPPKNYMEAVANQHGKYIPRLYLQERSGGVIGANMMIGHNVVFDQDNMRVGFAKSDCKGSGGMYEKVSKPFKIKRRLDEVEDSAGAAGGSSGEGQDLWVRSSVSSSSSSSNEVNNTSSDGMRSLRAAVHGCPMVAIGPCSAICGRCVQAITITLTLTSCHVMSCHLHHTKYNSYRINGMIQALCVHWDREFCVSNSN